MILAEVPCGDDRTLSVDIQDGRVLLFDIDDRGCRVMDIPRAALLPIRDGLLRAWQALGAGDPRQTVLPFVARAA